ncbi:MAG: hypothetical protein ACI9CV_001940 [Ilumatobacter sp.]
MDGTLHRVRELGVTALRVLEVVYSERKGCRAIVIDEGGAMLDVWFWWYQASDGELVICREGAHDAADPGGIAALSYGDEQRRGVIDRVPRDVMALYLRSQLLESERFS